MVVHFLVSLKYIELSPPYSLACFQGGRVIVPISLFLWQLRKESLNSDGQQLHQYRQEE